MANDIEKLKFVDKAGLEQFWADVQKYLTRNYRGLPAGMQFSQIFQSNGQLHVLVEPFGGQGDERKEASRTSLGVYSKDEVKELISDNGSYLGQMSLAEINAIPQNKEPHNGDIINIKFNQATDEPYIDPNNHHFGIVINKWDGAYEHSSVKVADGDNVIYDKKGLPHVWDRQAGEYKVKQDATSVDFDEYKVILNISQDENGEISVTQQTIPTATVEKLGLTTLAGVVTDGDTVNDKAATPKAVAEAIAAKIRGLDVAGITGSTSKTITSISETDGLIDATYEDILVGTSNIDTGVVTTVKLADKAVTTDKINDKAVTTDKIDDKAVTTSKIDDDAVTTAKIDDGAVTSAKIANGTIQTEDIADSQITTAKIADSAVTTGKIAHDAVNGDKIADDAIGNEHIAANAVQEEQILDGSVTNSKIDDGAVTYEKVTNDTEHPFPIDISGNAANATHADDASHADVADDVSEGSALDQRLDTIEADISDLDDAKADKVTGATAGNFASLDAEGNLVDSGHKHADYKTVQAAVPSPEVPQSGTTTSLSFIDTVSQNANGEISATKKSVPKSDAIDSDSSDTLATSAAVKAAVQASHSKVHDLNCADQLTTGGHFNGKYVTSLSQSNGQMAYTSDNMLNAPSENSKAPVTGHALYEEYLARDTFDTWVYSLIPQAARGDNQLVDKAYVDAIGERLEARYLSSYDAEHNTYIPFPTYAAFLVAQQAGPSAFYYNGTPVSSIGDGRLDNNDIVVITADEEHPNEVGGPSTTRYRYQCDVTTGSNGHWYFEYVINNTALNYAQLMAINSGITPELRASYDAHLASNGHGDHPANPHHVTFDQLDGRNGVDSTELGVLDGVDTVHISSTQLNTLSGIQTNVTVQDQLDDKVERVSPKYSQQQDPEYDPHGKIAIIDNHADVDGRHGIEDSGAAITGHYHPTDNVNPATGSAIHQAIEALEGVHNGTAGKMSITVAKSDGIIDTVTIDDSGLATAVQGDKADSAVQTVKVFNNGGSGAEALIPDQNNAVTIDLRGYKLKQDAVHDPQAAGTTLEFIDTISQDDEGVITPTKKYVTVDQTYDDDGTNPASGAAITDAIGTLDATVQTETQVSPDSTKNFGIQVVEVDGQLHSVSIIRDDTVNQGDLDSSINALNVSDSIAAGKYITGLSETAGKIFYTQADMATDKVQNSTAPITAGGVYKAIDDLDATVASAGDETGATPVTPNFDFTLTEESGIVTGITVTRDDTVNQTELGDTVSSLNAAKANKVAGATNGDLAALNSSGDLVDSQKHITSIYSDGTAGEGHEKDEYLANPVTGTAVDAAIVDHLNQLDITKTSDQGRNVQVSVEQENGLLKSVNVTVDNTINRTDLTTAISNLDAEVTTGQAAQDAPAAEQAAHAGDVSKNIALTITEVDGKLTKAVVTQDNTINATNLSDAINALNATVNSAPATGVSTNIDFTTVETNGKLTGVTITRDASVSQTDVDNTIATEIGKLNATAVGGTGKYIAAISETGGVIAATEGTLSTQPTANSDAPITSGAVYAAITGLDKADTAVSHEFVTAVSEADGIITVSREQPSFSDISGTLPVSQGGTGATTEAGARTNLDVYSKGEVNNMVQGHGKFLGNLTVAEINALWSSANPPRNSDTVICVVNATHPDTTVYVDAAGQDTITVRNGEQLIVKGDNTTATWESVTGSFKLTQTPAADTKPVNDDFSVLDGFSQDANGEVTVTRHTLDDVTQHLHGLMSSSDKVKLDALPVRSDLDSALLTKVDKVTNAIANHIATFVSGGNVQDSGAAITSTYSDTDGTNPVTGVAVKSAIDALNETVSDNSTNVSVSVTETAGKLYSITVTDTAATSAQGVKADNSIRKAYVNQLVGGKTELTKDTSDENAIIVDLSGYKTVQTPVAGSTEDTGSQLTFVYDVTQNANGVVESKTRTVLVTDVYTATDDTTPITGKGVAHAITTLNPQFGSKADKVTNATAGNFAGLDANGNLTDSGHKHSDYKTVQTAKADPSSDGDTLVAIDSITQNANGEITATKKNIQSATTAQPGVVQLAGSIGATVSSENNLAATEKAVRDAIDSAVSTAVDSLDVAEVGGAGKYVSAISESNGKISATVTTMDTTPTSASTNAITSGGVYAALDALDATVSNSSTNVSVSVTESNGKLTSITVTDSAATSDHVHGNISNDGKVGTAANKVLVTTTDGVIEAGSIEGTYDATTNKIATQSTVSDAIEALDKSDITGFGAGKTLATLTETDGIIGATFQDIAITKSQVTDFSHAHGDITNDGKITANGAAIGSGDTLVIVDSSASGAVKHSTLAFDASTTDQFLAKNGTWSNTVERATKDASGNVITSTYETKTHASDTYIPLSQKGVANGVATLGNDGIIPSSQLPSYVDDVIEGYYDDGKFYEEAAHTTEITPESGKVYVDLPNNRTYRWSGTQYTPIASDLTLGETSSTAYRGDRGKAAYDHSQLTSGNPHNVTASDVGLGSVVNTGDSDTPVSGGTTKFTTGGAYTELAKKADKVTSATEDNFASFDENGNLKDSGILASNVKLKQTAVSDPTASGTTITAIDTISQDTNGVITATKKTIRSATTSQTGVVQLQGSIGATETANDKAATPKAVRDAINDLDSNATSSDGTNVQVKVTETDGKITAVNVTTDNTASSTHVHGSITNDGKIGSDSGLAVVTGTSGAVTTADLTTASPSVPSSGTTSALSFIDTVSQDSKGKITATKKNVTVDSTYSSIGTNPVNGKAIAAALGTLDFTEVGGEGKYISAVSESNGKISATATTMDTAPTANSKKAVTSGGVAAALAGYKPLQTAVNDPAASGTTITAIDTISQYADGVVTATKKTIRSASTSQTGVVQLQGSIGASETDNAKAATPKAVRDAITAAVESLDVSTISGFGTGKTLATLTETDGKIAATFQDIQIAESQVTNLTTDLAGKASSTHVHGNITNDGKITSDTAVANGMKLVITDGSSLVSRSGIAFDGSTETKALTPKGTWKQFLQEVSAGDGISVTSSGTTRTVALNLTSIPVATIAALA